MKKEYVYHRVVKNMFGKILYPLNQLKNVYPEAYKEHVKKYEGREKLLTTTIPTLSCLWNDVLHFTAVPPQELFNNLNKAGLNAQEIAWRKWFKVPIDLLDSKNTTVCLYRRDISIVADARDFSSFDPEKMEQYRTVPIETIEYYRDQSALGKRPLLFHRVPHILYKGTINTQDLEIVEI